MWKKKRDTTIDILRALALMGLVVAHVQPPDWMFQLRSFDVPMMVFLAGTSYSMSNAATIPYSKYVWHRFKRIIIPTWIFLLVFFFCFRHESQTTIILHFTLLTNWFVWIMRVFFIISICAPIVLHILQRSHLSYGLILIISLLFNEILCHHFTPPGTAPDAISTIVIMNVAYLIFFCIGYKIGGMSKQKIILIGIVAFCVYITMTLYYYLSTGHYVQTQEKKYPPPGILHHIRIIMHRPILAYAQCSCFISKQMPCSQYVYIHRFPHNVDLFPPYIHTLHNTFTL